MATAIEALESEDLVYLHVEAPDETSHEGSLQKKIQAIEEFDRYVVGEMIRFQEERNDMRILVAPDHATPVSLKTHASGPVPYAICGRGIEAGTVKRYTEKDAESEKLLTGAELFESFIKGYRMATVLEKLITFSSMYCLSTLPFSRHSGFTTNQIFSLSLQSISRSGIIPPAINYYSGLWVILFSLVFETVQGPS